MNNVAVYWQMAKQGQRLMLANGETQERIGGVRETPRGFDALAMTFGYEPEHLRAPNATSAERERQEEARAYYRDLEATGLAPVMEKAPKKASKKG